ncbi:MAG: PKD domain-containing protein, partial [Gammaproteobacteria bacterium]|nr:PKD domain-containing protein [Gammaproteobacteria bacterium]
MTGWRRGVLLLCCIPAGVGLLGCGGGGGSGGPPPNRPPTASFTATPDGGPPPLTVAFDASASSDADGSITEYAWDFGNTATGTGQTIDNTYDRSGVYEVRLTVTDDDGSQATAMREIVVNVLPTPRIEADPVDGQAPVTVTFDASMSSDEDGEIVSYEWDVAGAPRTGVTNVEHAFEEPGVYPVRLTVTDDLGGAAEDVIEVKLRDDANVPYTLPNLPTPPNT